MYRRVLERMVMAHFNDKLTACVNTGIASCAGSSSGGQPTGSSGRGTVDEPTPVSFAALSIGAS